MKKVLSLKNLEKCDRFPLQRIGHEYTHSQTYAHFGSRNLSLNNAMFLQWQQSGEKYFFSKRTFHEASRDV